MFVYSDCNACLQYMKARTNVMVCLLDAQCVGIPVSVHHLGILLGYTCRLRSLICKKIYLLVKLTAQTYRLLVFYIFLTNMFNRSCQFGSC